MKIDLQDVTETRKTLAVTLEASEIEAEEKSLLDQFTKMAKIPGFRPGKAPLPVVRKRYAKEVAKELKQRVVSKAYQDGSKQAEINLINVVNVDEDEIASGQDATFTFTLDVQPEFEVKDYKGYELTGLSEEVKDEEVDEAIDNMRRERADFQPVEREAQKTDYVKFSHEGTIDGNPISDIVKDKPIYAKMPQTWEEVGSEQGLIPGLADQLEGLKTGDKKEVEVTFPDTFQVEELKGKKATYAVEVLEVRERKLPEMDDAFFKAQQVKDLDELKERVSTYLSNQKQQQRHVDLRRQVSEKLAASVDFALPESLIAQETEQAMRQIVAQNAQRGITQEAMEEQKEQIHADAQNAAQQRVKLQLILSQVAEKEDINIDNEDISRYVMGQAYQTGRKPEEIVKELKKNSGAMQATQRSLLMDKTLELVVNEATVSNESNKEA